MFKGKIPLIIAIVCAIMAGLVAYYSLRHRACPSRSPPQKASDRGVRHSLPTSALSFLSSVSPAAQNT